MNRDFSKGTLNHYYRSHEVGINEIFSFPQLVGVKILDVGFVPDSDIEGGLAIDFEKNGEKQRIVFAFNELGIWKEWEGKIEE